MSRAPSARSSVEVVEGPDGRQLRVGGTVASQYRSDRLLTGSVWDAIAISLLALPPARRRDVLLLGLGGGSVARLLRALAPDARIVGVEHEPAVVEAARASFDLDRLGVDVRIDDAGRVLARAAERFDLVIEDCFVGGEQGLAKPAWILTPGLTRARDSLKPGGVLVCNVIHEAAEVSRVLERAFASVLRVELRDCVNHVLLASDGALEARGLRALVRAEPVLAPALPNLRLRTVQRPPRGGQGSRRSASSTRSSSCPSNSTA